MHGRIRGIIGSSTEHDNERYRIRAGVSIHDLGPRPQLRISKFQPLQKVVRHKWCAAEEQPKYPQTNSNFAGTPLPPARARRGLDPTTRRPEPKNKG